MLLTNLLCSSRSMIAGETAVWTARGMFNIFSGGVTGCYSEKIWIPSIRISHLSRTILSMDETYTSSPLRTYSSMTGRFLNECSTVHLQAYQRKNFWGYSDTQMRGYATDPQDISAPPPFHPPGSNGGGDKWWSRFTDFFSKCSETQRNMLIIFAFLIILHPPEWMRKVLEELFYDNIPPDPEETAESLIKELVAMQKQLDPYQGDPTILVERLVEQTVVSLKGEHAREIAALEDRHVQALAKLENASAQQSSETINSLTELLKHVDGIVKFQSNKGIFSISFKDSISFGDAKILRLLCHLLQHCWPKYKKISFYSTFLGSSKDSNTERVKVVMEELASNTTIEELDLGRCHICDNDIVYIVAMLEKNSHIKTINLSHNLITDEGARQLFKVLRKDKNKRRTSLTDTCVSADMKNELKQVATVFHDNR